MLFASCTIEADLAIFPAELGEAPIEAGAAVESLSVAIVEASAPMPISVCWSCPGGVVGDWVRVLAQRKASQVARTPTIAAAGIPMPSPSFTDVDRAEDEADSV